MEKYILIGEIANKLSGNQEIEAVIFEIASIFLGKQWDPNFIPRKRETVN